MNCGSSLRFVVLQSLYQGGDKPKNGELSFAISAPEEKRLLSNSEYYSVDLKCGCYHVSRDWDTEDNKVKEVRLSEKIIIIQSSYFLKMGQQRI